ncbi:hypothetical protein ACJJTC_006133, partial [Scirpophaga incertulas]
ESTQKTVPYSEVESILRAAWPAAVPAASTGKDWLHSFAENLKKDMEKLVAEKMAEKKAAEKTTKSSGAEPNARLEELRAQNDHLQGLVDKYKRIIDDTKSAFQAKTLSQSNSPPPGRRFKSTATKCDHRRTAVGATIGRETGELDDLRQRTVSQEPLGFSIQTLIERKSNFPSLMVIVFSVNPCSWIKVGLEEK